MSEKFIEYEGFIRITVELGDGEVIQIQKDKATIQVIHQEHTLPDEHSGYVVNMHRKEDVYTFSIITSDNLDFSGESEEEDTEDTDLDFLHEIDLSPEEPVDPGAETEKIDYDDRVDW